MGLRSDVGGAETCPPSISGDVESTINVIRLADLAPNARGVNDGPPFFLPGHALLAHRVVSLGMFDNPLLSASCKPLEVLK